MRGRHFVYGLRATGGCLINPVLSLEMHQLRSRHFVNDHLVVASTGESIIASVVNAAYDQLVVVD